MFLLRLLTFAFCLLVRSKGQDAKYCGLRYKSKELFGSTPYQTFGVMIASTDLNVPDSVIHINPLAILKPNKNGVFINPPQIITPPFCVNKFLESGDIDGDGRDDLICFDFVTGEFTVSMLTNNGYQPSKRLADTEPVFKCSGTLKIGDFDGNGADDLLCGKHNVDNTERVSYTIYFNSACNHKRQKESLHNYHDGHRGKTFHQPARKNQYAIGSSLSDYYGCKANLPRQEEQTGILPCTDTSHQIIIADIDGDDKDDIVCWDGIGGSVSYFLSKPASLNAVFSKEVMTTFQCQIPLRSLYVSDVDADSDADFICVGQVTSSSGNLPQVSFYTPSGFLATETFYDDCGAAEFCSFSKEVYASLFVGDFNNDNRADILCRYTERDLSAAVISKTHSEIVFAEPR